MEMPLSPVKLNLFSFDEHAFGSWLVHLNSIFMKQNHMLSYFLRLFFLEIFTIFSPHLKNSYVYFNAGQLSAAFDADICSL